MRLIDEEALMERIAKAIKTTDMSVDYVKGVSFVVGYISNAPTIQSETTISQIHADRPKGKWIKYHKVKEDSKGVEYVPHWECSHCHTGYDPFYANTVNFCPNCGAKMDKGGDTE